VLLVASDPVFGEHDPGAGHPERPSRLRAVIDGLGSIGIDPASSAAAIAPRDATLDELELVHDRALLDALEGLARRGGGALDADTAMSARSWDAARRAAGAGLAAVDALGSGRGTAAFCAVRPPGHHATPRRAMGFCLVNNVAVTAAALAARGERPMVLDWDAHHGNGTQDAFYSDPRVLYVSLHEWPLYPGTGALHETGVGAGEGTTCNVYLTALDDVVLPLAEAFGPTWLLVSAGFDAHRADPLTGLCLSAGDFADLASRAIPIVPPGRTIVFLEGGYDLDALRNGVAATAAALLGEDVRPEHASAGGPGAHVVQAARDLHVTS
jgi:acetoin utilization deacetylase AcuC-like enzyme